MGTHLKMSYAREQNFARTLQAKQPVKPKPRAQHQGHFDPDELTRRLYLVLAEQKAHAEKKKARYEETILRDARSWTRRQFSNREGGKKSVSKEVVLERTSPSKDKSSEKPPCHSASQKAAAGMSADKARIDQPLRQQKSFKSKIGPPAAAKEKEASAAKPISVPGTSSSTGDGSYHHVPQEAARQFTRTTTVDGMLSNPTTGSGALNKMALKHQHTGRVQTDSVLTTALESTRRARDRRIIPEEVSSSDEETHTPPEYRHTFQGELLRAALPPDQRRNSTGDILQRTARASSDEQPRRSMVLVESLAEALAEDVIVSSSPPHARLPLSPSEVDEHRVDWTQSDEIYGSPKSEAQQAQAPAVALPKTRTGLGPLLRKADSIWMMKGRKGSTGVKTEGGGDLEKIRSESPSKSDRSPKSPKSGGGGFFAKFKARG
jgi:hypothetical protein